MPRSARLGLAGLVATLVFVAAGQSAKKPADPIGDLQGKVVKEIRGVVKDSGRIVQLDAAFQELFDVVRQMWKETSEYRAKSDALNADYDATPQQFEELYAAHVTRHKALLRQAVEIRGRVAELLTDDEWKKLADMRADIRKLGLAID